MRLFTLMIIIHVLPFKKRRDQKYKHIITSGENAAEISWRIKLTTKV